VKLIPETCDKSRKVIADVDPSYVRSLLPEVPAWLKEMLKYCSLEEDIIKLIDYDDLRKEILIMLSYDTVVPPSHVTKGVIVSICDTNIQGSKDNVITFDLSPENCQMVANRIVKAKTLEGFGGLLRKYCPKRCEKIFHLAVNQLMDLTNTEAVLVREKLVTLLSNQINYSVLYIDIAHYCWQPLVSIADLVQIVGKDELQEIENKNKGKKVVHCYRASNLSNRHGYGNLNPNMNYTFTFQSYSYRQ